MTRRRRALLLGGLALLLGTLAAADIAGREAALNARIGRAIPVVIASQAIPKGARLRPALLALREVPARYAPRGSFGRPGQLAGQRAAVDIPAGSEITGALLDSGEEDRGASPGSLLRPGERVAELVARGSPDLVYAGGHVDVLVTREHADGAGDTTIALEDAEVLAAAPVAADADKPELGPRVSVSLRVTLRQAVELAAAQNFAREVRILPRAPGDHRRGAQGLRRSAG